MLAPNEKDIAEEFTREFAGMTAKPIELNALTAARNRLNGDIRARLKGSAADFLMGLQSGAPGFHTYRSAAGRRLAGHQIENSKTKEIDCRQSGQASRAKRRIEINSADMKLSLTGASHN